MAGVVSELMLLTGSDSVNVAHLNRGGPLIRDRALATSMPLYESAPGAFAGAQAAATAERIETDPMRRASLGLLAE